MLMHHCGWLIARWERNWHRGTAHNDTAAAATTAPTAVATAVCLLVTTVRYAVNRDTGPAVPAVPVALAVVLVAALVIVLVVGAPSLALIAGHCPRRRDRRLLCGLTPLCHRTARD